MRPRTGLDGPDKNTIYQLIKNLHEQAVQKRRPSKLEGRLLGHLGNQQFLSTYQLSES